MNIHVFMAYEVLAR